MQCSTVFASWHEQAYTACFKGHKKLTSIHDESEGQVKTNSILGIRNTERHLSFPHESHIFELHHGKMSTFFPRAIRILHMTTFYIIKNFNIAISQSDAQ